MPVPLTVSIPATAAAWAYLNAKSGVWYDWLMIKTAATGAFRMVLSQRRDKLNLFYLMEDHAQNPKLSNKTFLIFEGKSWTYSEAYDMILRYGAWLREAHGVKPKDIVAINYQNSETFIFIWWGLWSIGAKPAFINYNLTGKSLLHSISSAATALCVVDPEIAPNITDDIKASLPKTTFAVHTPEIFAAIAATKPVRAPDSYRTEEEVSGMAMLIYTSGTTGLPKPAIVSWGKCVVGATFADRLLERGNDVLYTAMPLYHSSAAMLAAVPTVMAGSTLAIGRKFSTKTFWKDVRDSKATAIQYVGETLRYLLAAPPQIDPITGENLDKKHNVRLAFGNGLRPDIWNRFKDRFGVETIIEFYSATEATLATWNVSSNDHTLGAIGRAGWLSRLVFRGRSTVVQVDWDNDTPVRDAVTGLCSKVQMGEIGELLFRLPDEDLEKRFQGYYNNPEASKAKILRNVLTKGDAWFRTGDVVRWDENGHLFFTDRIGDTFRWKSENVSTAEVSESVGTHSAVQEANVYGIELPNHDGRAGCVAICLDGGPTPETLRSLATHVKASLPKYAVPLFLRIVKQVGGEQTTGTNKQQKHSLREAGVRPGALNDKSEVYWFRGDTYVPFTTKDWRDIEGGRVKL